MEKKYTTSRKKIISTVVVMFVLFALTTIGGNLTNAFKANAIILLLLGLFTLLLVKFSYVEIKDGKIKYVNMLVERHSAPISLITRIGYPEQPWFAIYSYMYVLYDDPYHEGRDKVLKIIQGQFDERTLSEIAKDLKSINANIEIEKDLRDSR